MATTNARSARAQSDMRHMRRISSLMPLLVAVAMSCAARADAAGSSTPPAQQSPAALYHNYCSVCHGDRGDGRSRAAFALSPPPRDFTSAASKQEMTRERIVLAVRHGRPGTAMVGWRAQLSDRDIDRVSDYVLANFVRGDSAPVPPSAVSGTRAHGGREADAHAAAAAAAAATKATAQPAQVAVDMQVAFPAGLKGDTKRGAAAYLSNCAACHGHAGDGRGPRAYFINPKPRDFTEVGARARFNRVALYAAVSEGRVGSEMPAWNKVMSAQEIADVAEYVFQRFIRAQAAPAASAAAGAR